MEAYMSPKDREQRFTALKQMPCIACSMMSTVQSGKCDIHHLNLGGHAGQKRRGDEYTIPLCKWHHVGEAPNGMTAKQATMIFGPSLARMSRNFREQYGQDDALLAEVDRRIEVLRGKGVEA
jgi:hypothetical protein